MKPKIETVDALCENLADLIGVYGCCKAGYFNEDRGDSCGNSNPLCCRVGFVIQLKDRIYNAVENDMLIDKLNLNIHSDNNYDKQILEFLKENHE